MSGKKLSFDPEAMLKSSLEEISSIDARLVELAGNAAKVLAEATTAVGTVQAPFPTEAMSALVTIITGSDAEAPVITDDSCRLLELAASLTRASVKQATDEAVKAWIAEHKQDTGEGREALLVKRASAVELVGATATMAKSLGLELTFEIPSTPKSGKSGPSVKVSGAQYFRTVNGETTDQPASQNSVSSLAYYHGAKVMGQDNRPSTDEFVKWAAEQGVDVKQATGWTLEGKDVTVGMRVVAPEATTTTEAAEQVVEGEVVAS